MGNPTETGCQGEVSQEIVRLQTNKEELHDRIGTLFDRLQDLLGKPEQEPTPETTNKPLITSQLAIHLSSISCTIEADIEKVNNILNRLEL